MAIQQAFPPAITTDTCPIIACKTPYNTTWEIQQKAIITISWVTISTMLTCNGLVVLVLEQVQAPVNSFPGEIKFKGNNNNSSSNSNNNKASTLGSIARVMLLAGQSRLQPPHLQAVMHPRMASTMLNNPGRVPDLSSTMVATTWVTYRRHTKTG